MAIDSYMFFQKYGGTYLCPAESQVNMKTLMTGDTLGADFQTAWNSGSATGNGLFEIEDYSFDTEQAFNLTSQSRGIGAGKITLNPFSITRKIDLASPQMYQMSCNGTPFQQVSLGLRKGAGDNDASGFFFLRFDFKLVGVKTIAYAHDDESPKETITFVYGAMIIRYCQQNNDGSVGALQMGGWNQQQNKFAQASDTIDK